VRQEQSEDGGNRAEASSSYKTPSLRHISRNPSLSTLMLFYEGSVMSAEIRGDRFVSAIQSEIDKDQASCRT
jgi:hypothetical protein